MLLVLNTGSSSIKLAVFDESLTEQISGTLTGIGTPESRLRLGETHRTLSAADHDAGIVALMQALADAGFADFDAAAHRVVHGGAELVAPTRLTPGALNRISAMVPLAPLHNPPALAGIHAMQTRMPDLPQYASFDTAFHATQPDVITTYALPAEIRELGIRRYGFHGLSYAGMVDQFGNDLPDRLLAMHLGAGVSLCAIKAGQSLSTSMGYSPLTGPTMATRCGDIDGMAVLRLAQELGFEATDRILNKESGLLALGGSSDMRTLLQTDSDDARFAVDHFVNSIVQHAGSLIAAMDGADALAFTGGIGENSAEIRNRIVDRLSWLGELPVHVIPAAEERQIAKDAMKLMGAG